MISFIEDKIRFFRISFWKQGLLILVEIERMDKVV